MRPIHIFLAASVLCAQTLTVGSAMPRIEANSLADTKGVFPEPGKAGLGLFSFSREGGEASKPWTDRFEKERPGAVYVIPMLEGAPRLIRPLIRSGMRKEFPKAMQARTLPLYQGEREWKARLGFQKGQEAEPFLVLVNAQGAVVWMHRGRFDEKMFAELLEKVRQATP